MEDNFGIKCSLVCVYDALKNRREDFSDTEKIYVDDVIDYLENYNKFFDFLKGKTENSKSNIPNLRYIISLIDKDVSMCFGVENIIPVQNKLIGFNNQIRKLKSSPLEVYDSDTCSELRNFIAGIGNGLESNYDSKLCFYD